MKGACEAYGLVCWLVTIVERMDKEGRDVLVEKEIMEKEDGLYRAACRTMEEVVGIENEEDVERGAEKTSSLKSCAIREKIEFISIGKMGWGKGGVVDKCVHYARCGAFLQAMEKFDQVGDVCSVFSGSFNSKLNILILFSIVFLDKLIFTFFFQGF